MSGRIALCVADDHMVVQDGVRDMASRTRDIEFQGAASDGEGLFELLESTHPDVLLLDLRLGDADGVELCAVVHSRYPELRIVVFTAFGDTEALRAAVDAGAAAFVLKDTSTRSLPGIIRHVCEHGSYYDARLAGRLIRGVSGTANQEDLNERELMIVRLLAAGKVNHEIAAELNLSPHTIKFYVSRIMRKLGVTRRAGVVKVAFERKLL